MQPTKHKILSAVISYIKDQSNLESVTLANIAMTANIGKSTVYEHFSSKEALISETYLYLLNHYADLLTCSLESTTFKDAFIEQLKKILLVMEDAQSIMEALLNKQTDAFIGMGDKLHSCAKSLQNQMDIRFLEIFTMGIEEGIVSQNANPYQKYVIQALISGLLYQYVNQEMNISSTSLFELIYEYVLRVINH